MITTWQERLNQRDSSLHIHLLGIGGAGLNPIAQVLLELGVRVSGSDRQATDVTRRLAAAGAQVFEEQTAANFVTMRDDGLPDLVLYSSAVQADNPELAEAVRLGIPVVKRDHFLPALLAGRKLIAVAGTHGKSTTTAMITKILREAGIDAGYIIGANLPGYGNASAGTAEHFVLEADEYDQMFLGLTPTVAVITNVEWDHPDCYPTPASFQQAFARFVERVTPDGLIISCADDSGAEQLRIEQPLSDRRWITYGLALSADLCAVNPSPMPGGGYAADLHWWLAPEGRLQLQAPGLHNLRNAMAALAATSCCDTAVAQALQSLADYKGVDRRFEYKGEAQGVLVFDDYAHHPTEIRATLAGARSHYPQARIWAVFQPHTYSRTRALLHEMAASFDQADQVIVTDIFAAREQDDGTVSAHDLVAASSHPQIQHMSGLSASVSYLAMQVQPGDVVICLGAGDSYKIGEQLLQTITNL